MANSEVVTREDLKNVFEALGEGDYGTRIDALEDIADRLTTKEVLYSSASITVSSATTYTICNITIPANSKYLVLGYARSGVSSTTIEGCFITLRSGTPSVDISGGTTRTTMSNGGGLVAWRYFETGTTSISVDLQCYGYYTTSHTESGHLLGLPIFTTGIM